MAVFLYKANLNNKNFFYIMDQTIFYIIDRKSKIIAQTEENLYKKCT